MTILDRLHIPISPVASSTHSGLCTLVQAVPLALVFYYISQDAILQNIAVSYQSGSWSAMPIFVFIQATFALLAIAFAWHEYCTMTNYVAWHLTAIDTLIWFVAIIPESFLALSVTAKSFEWFSLCMSLTALAATIAYLRVYIKMRQPESKRLILNHFDSNHNLSEKIYAALLTYYRNATSKVCVAFLIYICIYIAFIATKKYEYASVIRNFAYALYFLIFVLGFRSSLADSWTALSARMTNN